MFLMTKVDSHYGNVIWTNHALQRLKERNLDQSEVWSTFKHSDTSSYAWAKRAYKYQKIVGNRLIEVIAKKNEKGEWLILSCWDKPAWKFKVKLPLWEKVIKWVWKKLFQ